MEGYAPKAAEASGEEGAMARGTTKSLKAAAAAIGPHGLFAGYSAKGKADQETAASAVERAFAMSAPATAMAQKAMEAAQQAAVLAAAASKQADAEKQAKEANQAEEEEVVGEEEEEEQEAAAAIDAYATDSEDEEDGMTSMEYIMTYKELPPFEVELIMQNPVQRTLFADTEMYKALIADPSTTQEDIDDAAYEHEENQNMRIRFHDWVRSEYEAKGYVAVSDEYIARRARTEEFSRKLWEEGFSDSDSEDDVEEGAH